MKISDIVRDMLLQPRAELHRDWIEEYARDIQAGATFPPIVVFFDGNNHWLADGFHRTYAREVAGFTEIDADIRSGTRRDALRYSISANAQHGYRRTNHDKRRAVDIMLDDPEWSQLTDREIAAASLVGDRFVSSRRRERLPADITEPDEAHDALNAGSEQPALDECVVDAADSEAAADSIEPFDWEASKLRNSALEAIRELAALPSARDVIAAWMKSDSYGEPVETLEQALAWLNAFLPLYRDAEPRRWARVQMAAQETGMAHAAE